MDLDIYGLSQKRVEKKVREKFEYIEKNLVLLEVLFDEILTEEKIAKILEENGENVAGLLIRLEMGIRLGLISYDGKSLKGRNYFLTKEGESLLNTFHVIKEDEKLFKIWKEYLKEEKEIDKKTRAYIT